MKIKITGVVLIALAVLSLGLAGCGDSASIPRQITSLNVDCETQEVEISDETEALNGEATWTAKCQGKTYRCSYLPESGSDCYELSE